MQTDQHIFIRKVIDENSSIDAELLSQILSPKFMSPDYSGVKNIVEMLCRAHEVALRFEWPYSEQIALLKRYDTLLAVKNTHVYNNDYSIELVDPFLNLIKAYPFSALFSQPFNLDVTPEQKDVLLLLVLMFFQVFINSNVDETKTRKSLITIADGLRALVRDVYEKHEQFQFSINFDLFKYQRLKTALDKISQVDELNIDDSFSDLWLEISLSFTDIENDERQHKEARDLAKQIALGTTEESVTDTDLKTKKQEDTNNNRPYGNRLTTEELMHLPHRSNTLAEHEINELFPFIQHALTNEESRKSAIIAMLLALTSKSFDNISNIKFFSKKPKIPSGDYIDLNSGVWARKSIKMPVSYSQKETQENCLSKHTKWLYLSLPTSLIDSVKLAFFSSNESEGKTIGELYCEKQSIDTQLTSFLKTFWKNNLSIHRCITPASVRGLMFNKLAHKHNPAYAALLLANTEYINPTTLYYVSAETNKLANDYNSMLCKLGMITPPSELNTNAVTGSELSFNIDYINSFMTSKRESLSKMLEADSNKLSFDELIERHNFFSCYITSMLLAATGHRERKEFGFSTYAWDLDGSYILLRDKVNYEDSTIRILPLSNIIIEQLTSYQNFCKDTARQVKKFNPVLTKKIASSAILSKSQFPTISYISKKDIRAISNDDLSTYFGATLSIPLNCFRHYLSHHLNGSNEFNFSNLILGHANNGEHLLSDYSCTSLVDLKSVTTTKDELLEKLGFKTVTYKSPLGPKLKTEKNELNDGYRADFLYRSEKKELKALNKWGRGILGAHVNDLLNLETREKTQKIIIENGQKDESCGIAKRTRIHWLKKQIHNTLEKGTLILTSEASNLHVETNLLIKMRQSKEVKSLINDFIFSDVDDSSGSQLAKIMVSLIVNAKADIPVTKSTIAVIQASPTFENGVAWFNFGGEKRVIIDSITSMLILKSSSYKSSTISKDSLGKLIEDKCLSTLRTYYLFNNLESEIIGAFSSLTTLSKYIRDSRDENQSALAFSCQNGYLKTTSLSPEVFTRWLSPEPVKLLSKQTKINQEAVNSLNYMSSINSGSKCQKKSQDFLKAIQKALGEQYKQKKQISTTDLLIQIWGAFISAKNETSIEQLIEKSSMLNEAAILLIIWAIDTSKKKDKRGRVRAIGTAKTHLSNVAQPLLEQLKDENILSLTSNELAAVYKKAINARAVKKKGKRASEFRLFHRFLQSNFDFLSLDWQEIEPTINHDEHVSANIISMSEYSRMMSVLNNDECFNESDRNINQIILLLCYRCGLRVGETTFLMLQDIDTDNWIIHVRSYYYHRLKSSASNRRIPVGLLLNNNEKELLKKQINRVKCQHSELTNLWLFSDKTNAQCLVNLTPNLSRVRETIRLISGDNELCLHHCRHSFANYLLLCMHDSYYPIAITNELKMWAGTEDLSTFTVQLRQSLLFNDNDKRQILYAIARAMGHSTPKTTLRHYIHVLDVIHASENEKSLFNQNTKHENHPAFIKKRKHPVFALLDINQANRHQILSRNEEFLGYQPLVSHAQKSWVDYQRTAVSRVTREFNLSDIRLKKQNQELSQLYEIEHIIRAAENGLSNVKITQLLCLDFQFVTDVVNTALSLKKQLSYAGIDIAPDKINLTFETNQRRLSTFSKYIRMPSFQSTLQKVVEILQDDVQAKLLSHIWQDSYEKNRGFIIAPDDYKRFVQLISVLAYQMKVIDGNARVKRRYGYKTGIHVKFYPITDISCEREYGDNKIHHAIFLLTMALLIQKTSN